MYKKRVKKIGIISFNPLSQIFIVQNIQNVGSLEVACSGGYGPKIPYFEPIHGFAPDIVGKKNANPTAATC